jgi:serine/threonine protein kinase
MKAQLQIILVLSFLSTTILSQCSKYISHFPKYTCVNEDPLNKGSNASAYVVKNNDKEFVMKHQETSDDSRNELMILQKLKNAPYVVQIIDHVETNDDTLFIITYGEQGNLENYIQKLKEIKYEDTINLFKKIFVGVDAIHKAGYVHADLKLMNIVIDSNGDPIIIDFDISVEINTISNPKGTINYMAPEILRNFILSKPVIFTPETDYYSLCVMLYEMYNKTKPYDLFEISYNTLMKSEINFFKDQPREFYIFISNGIMPASHRMTFERAILNLKKMPRKKGVDLLENDRNYRMAENVGAGEELLTADEENGEGNSELNILLNILIFLIMISAIVFGLKYIDKATKQTNKDDDNTKKDSMFVDLNKAH